MRDTSKLDENRQLGGGEQADAAGSVLSARTRRWLELTSVIEEGLHLPS